MARAPTRFQEIEMLLQFETVDVFTADQFSGNPLAVVLNAEGLSTEQMQAVAAEFNLAETTFVLPPKDAAHTAEVRIFTPRYEMPFAGHPNVGTAFVLARAGVSYGRDHRRRPCRVRGEGRPGADYAAERWRDDRRAPGWLRRNRLTSAQKIAGRTRLLRPAGFRSMTSKPKTTAPASPPAARPLFLPNSRAATRWQRRARAPMFSIREVSKQPVDQHSDLHAGR